MTTAHYRAGYALHKADHAMGTVFDAALRPLGITAAQAGVLLHLDRYPRATMAELSRLAAVTPQTMHRLVVGMERRGLVRRQRLDDDRKSLKVEITGQGAGLLGRAEVILMREQDALLESFTSSELDQLAGFLGRFERVFSSRQPAGAA
jgi:DNA-binding MarR family transcriptional regulator